MIEGIKKGFGMTVGVYLGLIMLSGVMSVMDRLTGDATGTDEPEDYQNDVKII